MKVVLPDKDHESLFLSEIFVYETDFDYGLEKYVVLTKGHEILQIIHQYSEEETVEEVEGEKHVFAYLEKGDRVIDNGWMDGTELYTNLKARLRDGWEITAYDRLDCLVQFLNTWHILKGGINDSSKM